MGEGKNRRKKINVPQNQGDEDKQSQERVEDIVLQVYMHCDGCATKVAHCLHGFDGVEKVKLDRANNKVIVSGEKAEPSKVIERIRKKYSTNAELISPKPKTNNGEDKKEPQKKDPQVKVVILKMYMHCEGCARDIKKNIARIDGVLTVEPDMSKSQVTVKGEFDPPKLAEAITKRLGKFVEIVKEEAAKSKKNHKKDNENNMMHYPPQHPFNKNFYSCLSDEAIHSCFVM
ncbi:hypothetical protein WN944_020061 [Citrus x changshan-huyou]|uniref:HMA domain-containing protein n=1 Tax=Citrus x changshan-huyou TaxID=2935761 RepID=A0AAP0LXG8_9ROSI